MLTLCDRCDKLDLLVFQLNDRLIEFAALAPDIDYVLAGHWHLGHDAADLVIAIPGAAVIAEPYDKLRADFFGFAVECPPSAPMAQI